MTETSPSPVIPPETLGWRLRRALAFAGISVEALADELDVNRKTVGNWAHDRNPVRDIYLKLIALRCGVPYEWLKDGATVPFASAEGDSSAMNRSSSGDNHLTTQPTRRAA